MCPVTQIEKKKRVRKIAQGCKATRTNTVVLMGVWRSKVWKDFRKDIRGEERRKKADQLTKKQRERWPRKKERRLNKEEGRRWEMSNFESGEKKRGEMR